MKIKPADTWFSKAIRHSRGYECECRQKCTDNCKQLHVHHLIGRGKSRRLRWSPLNVILVCVNCHDWMHGTNWESGPWLERYIGSGALDLLTEMRNEYIKIPVSQEKEISKHYRDELRRMESEGSTDLQSWI